MFDLGDLADFRGQSVDSVLREAVRVYLFKTSFNHPGDLKQMLEWLSMDPTIIDAFARDVGGMMARRHWIVHRGDRNDSAGKGQHPVRSISKSAVAKWLSAAAKLGEAVLLAAEPT